MNPLTVDTADAETTSAIVQVDEIEATKGA
jgi:hypothetical protein